MIERIRAEMWISFKASGQQETQTLYIYAFEKASLVVNPLLITQCNAHIFNSSKTSSRAYSDGKLEKYIYIR